jgi:hypothetical protein
MKRQRIVVGRWDKGIPYETLFTDLFSLYNQFVSIFNSLKTDKTIAKRVIYTSIALIQLKNGLRESEAVDVLMKFAETGERKFRFIPRKNNFERTVKIPDFLFKELFNKLWQF